MSGDAGQRRRYCKGCRASDQDKAKTRTALAQAQGAKFKEIRDAHLKDGKKWEDPEFPARVDSIGEGRDNLKWLRATEICENPRMYVGGASRFDVKQGDLGNCWFLASVASLCGRKKLLERVVPINNSFVESYAGIFHFQLWQYGRWVDVLIDDRLPTIDGRLAFMHSAENNEFWSALLEKAYAKINGSYEALRGGNQAEAMEDFTGGVCEVFNFQKEIPANGFEILQKAINKGSLIGVTIEAQANQIENILPNGLVIGHAYSLTGAKLLDVGGQKVKLVRIRNPWGNQYEWKGAWGDGSPEWKQLNDKQKKTMGLSFEDDGEFWMTYDDFIANFQKLEICNLGPDSTEEEGSTAKRYQMTMEDGSWKKKVNAGGCRNFLDTFWTNPQYRVQVVDGDEDDDDNMGTLIIAIMQKERRKKKSEGQGYLTMGYTIYEITDPNVGILDMNFFKFNKSVARSPFSNMREICGRHRLAPGHYVIIPSTFQPNEEGDFLVRIFTEKPAVSKEMDEETKFVDLEEMEKTVAETGVGVQSAPQNPAKGVVVSENLKRRKKASEVTEDDVQQERRVRDVFRKMSGEDLEVDAFELRTILNQEYKKEFKFEGFTLETSRSMVAMKDLDKSGKLGYEEFKALWGELRQWKKIFTTFDQDKSGTFNSHELRQALSSAGIQVSNATYNSLVMRYSDQDGHIFFDDFILCAIRLRSMFEIYKEQMEGSGPAKFSLDEFIQLTMYS